MTAGHVVHIKNSGVPGRDGWVKSIQVMPGRNGGTLPYGSATSTSFRSVKGWTDNGDQTFDYGAIILPTDLGNTTGWFGFGAYPDADLLASTGNISGYPGDKPSGTQWYDSRTIASVDARKVYYDIDTAGGQSGSAVYRVVDGDVWGTIMTARLPLLDHYVTSLEEAAALLEPGSPGRNRVEETREYFAFAREGMADLAERWAKYRAERAPSSGEVSPRGGAHQPRDAAARPPRR